ncbi:MAG: hypothetical protein P4M02_10805, partial [Clostridia bacterium]|nr:hypothetical protein [Clostridia bacterium]
MKPVKIIRAEAFDLMQYFYGSAHDPLIHCRIRFSSHLDEAALKRAVTLSQQAVPLLRCRFNAAARRPRWEECGFSEADIVRVSEGNDADAERLLASTIDIAREPQLKLFLIRGESADTLCAMIN